MIFATPVYCAGRGKYHQKLPANRRHQIRGSDRYQRMVAGNLLLRLLSEQDFKLQSSQLLPFGSI
jgi:hypothetical protein